jgi:hypothetical protein
LFYDFRTFNPFVELALPVADRQSFDVRWKMKIAIPIFLVMLLFGCGEPRESSSMTRISVFSTGRSHPDKNDVIIKSYGSCAIRIDNGTAQIRIYKITKGKRILEDQFELDSQRHPMAWVTPSLTDGEVQFEFGMEEVADSSTSSPHYYTKFSNAELVGSALTNRKGSVSDEEERLVIYYVKLDRTVSLPVVVTDSIIGMTKFSENNAVEFYLVTAASE